MKKSFLLLLSLCWLTVHAQYISREAIYHFADPESIGIEPSTSNGGTVALANKTLSQGYINATFGRETQNDAPPTIWTYKHPYQSLTEYYLRMTSGSTITFTATRGCLKSINFETEGTQGKLGNLQLRSEVGKLNTETGVWNDEGGSTSSVTFRCGNSMAFISNVIVSYEESSVSLIPSISPSHTDTLYSFSSLELTYSYASGNMSVASSTGITIQGDYDDSSLGSVDTTLTPTASGNKVRLTIANSIVKDGTFTIVVPARCFKDEEGYENTALTTTVTVREDRATFNPLSIDPDTTNTLTALTFPITLQFPNSLKDGKVGKVDEEKIIYLYYIDSDNSWQVGTPLKAKKDTLGQVKIIDESGLDPIIDPGLYKIEIPEGVVFNQFGLDDLHSRHNAVLDLVYSVVDPLKEKKDSVDMLVLEVKSLLADYVGKLGYPINAGYLTAVKDLAVEDSDGEEELTTKINNLQGALNAFYNDTNIVLPEKGKWYTISSVNKEDKEIPLSFVDGGVTIGGTPAAFQIDSIAKNGTVVLRLKVGKDDGGNTIYNYLHVLVADDRYSDMTPKNVLSNRDHSLTKLKLGKMLLSASDGDSTPDQSIVAGLLTIKGPMGNLRANNEAVDSTFALVSHSQQGEIVTPETVLHFENVLTSAFKFAETDEPKDVVPTVTVKPIAVIVGESVLTSNSQVLTLKIQGKDNADDVAHVALKDLSGVKFTYKDGGDATSTANPILEKIVNGSSDNLFKVHVNNLDDSTYTLVLPAGTFDFSENLKAVKDTVLTVNFTIDRPAPVDYSDYGALPETWGTIPTLIQGDAVADSALLDVYYYVTSIDVYPNRDAAYNVVELRERWTNTLIVKGHFEPVYKYNLHMLKIVYDESLKDKLPLKDDDYTFVIGRASYGDENFNKRQNGNTSIPESACRVNKRVLYNNLTIAKPVEPTDPTGVISHIYLPDDKGVYFDMQGRRVSNPTKGIYILNGRKVVIK